MVEEFEVEEDNDSRDAGSDSDAEAGEDGEELLVRVAHQVDEELLDMEAGVGAGARI